MSNGKQYEKAESVVKAGKSYTAIIKTSAGDITVELSKDTPVTTNNFVFLAKDGFYTDVIFHRVIPGFMIQGGDPTGTGMGGPGYKFADEKFTGEYKRGTIAMANSGPNTNGSQFFIMHADYPLPPNYVIFGMTTSGLDVVDKIASGKTGPSDRPVEPVSIKSIEILEK
ncbi:peptidylprolyl isomerase [Candidatus Woesebacteria bacterium]|nr:peptidylprolyl isomerase [Candidatus Woesebacteria bacterium]